VQSSYAYLAGAQISSGLWKSTFLIFEMEWIMLYRKKCDMPTHDYQDISLRHQKATIKTGFQSWQAEDNAV